jgi:hypothetical protein
LLLGFVGLGAALPGENQFSHHPVRLAGIVFKVKLKTGQVLNPGRERVQIQRGQDAAKFRRFGTGASQRVPTSRIKGQFITEADDAARELKMKGCAQGLCRGKRCAARIGAQGVIVAAPDAKQPAPEALEKITATATATIGGKEVTKQLAAFRNLKVAPKPKLLVRLEPQELVVAPGTTISAVIKVERNGFDDLVKFTVENMPHGVIVDNIGLSGVMMPKGSTERQIFITADPWVPETTCLCFAVSDQAGRQCSPPVVIHIRRPSPLAEAGK